MKTIDISQCYDYYHAEIINCNIRDYVLEIEVEVLLKKLNSQYRVFQLTSIPFSDLNNNICKIDTDI